MDNDTPNKCTASSVSSPFALDRPKYGENAIDKVKFFFIASCHGQTVSRTGGGGTSKRIMAQLALKFFNARTKQYVASSCARDSSKNQFPANFPGNHGIG